jgi:hypothetical protein
VKVGCPRQYETVEELVNLIEDYFDSCWVDKVTETTDKDGKCTMSTVRYQARPYTVTGLALHLNLTRQGLLNYQARPEFVDAITRAKQMVEMGYEETLFSKFANGASFGLKENFGWKDVQHRSHSFDFSKCTDEELEAIAAGQGEA